MRQIDIILLSTVFLLCAFGLFMIYDVSSLIAFRDFGDKYHYIKEQSLWATIGMILLFFFSSFDYHRLYNLSLPLLISAIVFLLLVFIPGIGIRALGATRWVNFGFFTFQPAEFVKLSLAIYLSAWFSKKEKGRFLAFLLLVGLVFTLIILQPDMGTAMIVLMEGLIIYFLSGGNIFYFLALVPVMLAGGFAVISFAPYRLQRLTSFLKTQESLNNTSYHVKQILIALGMGGVFGVGLGNSLQKYAYLPENVTDSIFAIIAEELGFVGATILIFLFIVVVIRGLNIAMKARDNFGRLLAGGIVMFIGLQVMINLAAMVVFVPLTGIPLPFISYGGSALIVDLSAVGILLNISKQSNHI